VIVSDKQFSIKRELNVKVHNTHAHTEQVLVGLQPTYLPNFKQPDRKASYQ